MAVEEEPEEKSFPKWMMTYADMFTLLTVFFILLYAMSTVNIEKFVELAVSVRSGFDGPTKDRGGFSILTKGQVAPLPAPREASKKVDNLRDAAQSVAALVDVNSHNEGLGQALDVNRLREAAMAKKPNADYEAMRNLVDSLRSNMDMKDKLATQRVQGGYAVDLLGEEIFYPKGSARLTPGAQKALKTIAGLARIQRGHLSVEGYTGAARPGSDFPTNWDLSAARAMAVVKALSGPGGIEATRLSGTGHGVWHGGKNAPANIRGSKDRVRVLLRR